MAIADLELAKTDEGIVVKYWRYESGAQEMSCTMPEVIQGAGPIGVATAFFEDQSRRWRIAYGYGAGNQYRSTRQNAVDAMLEFAKREYQVIKHLHKPLSDDLARDVLLAIRDFCYDQDEISLHRTNADGDLSFSGAAKIVAIDASDPGALTLVLDNGAGAGKRFKITAAPIEAKR